VDEALAENPHLKFKRLPSYSPQLNPIERFWKMLRRRATHNRPQLNPIERFWKMLRRRATHNRLFDSLADLKGSIRNSLCYFQTMRARVKTLLNGRRKRTANRAAS
jgi:transposase